MKKTETLAVRLKAEEKAEIENLAESLGLLPADIIRQSVRAVLDAAKNDAGEIRLPIKVRTFAEDRARAALNDSVSECLWSLNQSGDSTADLIAAVERLGRTAQEHKDTLGLTLKQRAEVVALKPTSSAKLRAKS